jgi:hypothetical protein
MQVGNLRNNERSIHFAPLICECCAAQTMRRMLSTNRFGRISSRPAALLRKMPAEPHGTI